MGNENMQNTPDIQRPGIQRQYLKKTAEELVALPDIKIHEGAMSMYRRLSRKNRMLMSTFINKLMGKKEEATRLPEVLVQVKINLVLQKLQELWLYLHPET